MQGINHPRDVTPHLEASHPAGVLDHLSITRRHHHPSSNEAAARLLGVT